MSGLLDLRSRLVMRLRLARINRRAGMRVHSTTWVAPTARLQTRSDGVDFGGRIETGEWVTLSDGAILAAYGGAIAIGARSYVGPYCVLYGHGGITIGENVGIGAHSVVVAANHGFERTDVPRNTQPLTKEGIEIEEDVWIGSGCRILDGVRIGRGAVVGAGSVVTGDVAPYSVVCGVPARFMRERGAKTAG